MYFRSGRADFRPNRLVSGLRDLRRGTNGMTEGRTKVPLRSTGLRPLGAAAQKVDFRPDRAGFRFDLISGLGGLVSCLRELIQGSIG